MRQSNSATHSVVKKRKARGLPVASSIRATANFLSLPAISEKITVRSLSTEDDRTWLEVAKLCANLVGDGELVISNKTTARQIVSQALSVWASKHCANTKVLDSFSLVASLDSDIYGLDHCEDPSKTPMWFIGVNSEQTVPYINVKNKIEALEQAYPGLGRTAIHYAEVAGFRTFAVFSPSMGFYHGQNLYWCGGEDDADVLQEVDVECYEEGDLLLPSQYKAAFPEIYFTGALLDGFALQEIALAETEAGNTAKTILSIMDLADQGARLPDLSNYEGESVYFSAYMALGAEHNTMFNRVLDDFYQATGEYEHFTATYGIAELPFEKTSFCSWRDEMEKGFSLYQKLDHLMQLIGEVNP